MTQMAVSRHAVDRQLARGHGETEKLLPPETESRSVSAAIMTVT